MDTAASRFYAVKRLKQIAFNKKLHSFTSEMHKKEEIMYTPANPSFIELKWGSMCVWVGGG